MGVYGGPDLNESGLVLALDAGNRKCFANSVINSISWNLGSGGATYYSQNGNTNENERVLGTDPFGKSSIVWETRASGDNGADGGWESNYFGIDNTKLYRFSVWVKRTSTTSGGYFYLGLYGNASGIRRTDNNAVEGNPYWECSGTSKFDKDVWYLVVGHCYPYNTSYTGQHPESGIYTVSGGTTKVASINACNIGADVKWAGSDVTSAVHRCYHYYCGDSTTRLQLFDPRIDAIDGTEPSIAALLSGFTASRLANYNNDSIIGTFANTPTYRSSNGGSIVFDGSDDYIAVSDNSNLDLSGDKTLSCWIYMGADSSGCGIAGKMSNSVNGMSLAYGWDGNGFQAIAWNSANAPYLIKDTTRDINKWVHITAVQNGSTRWIYAWDGIGVRSSSYSGGTHSWDNNVGFYVGCTSNIAYFVPTNTRIADVKIYNRALTASEIQQNFNANRSRFGV